MKIYDHDIQRLEEMEKLKDNTINEHTVRNVLMQQWSGAVWSDTIEVSKMKVGGNMHKGIFDVKICNHHYIGKVLKTDEANSENYELVRCSSLVAKNNQSNPITPRIAEYFAMIDIVDTQYSLLLSQKVEGVTLFDLVASVTKENIQSLEADLTVIGKQMTEFWKLCKKYEYSNDSREKELYGTTHGDINNNATNLIYSTDKGLSIIDYGTMNRGLIKKEVDALLYSLESILDREVDTDSIGITDEEKEEICTSLLDAIMTGFDTIDRCTILEHLFKKVTGKHVWIELDRYVSEDACKYIRSEYDKYINTSKVELSGPETGSLLGVAVDTDLTLSY